MVEEKQTNSPVAAPSEPTASGWRGFIKRHPQIIAWLALSLVMVLLVVWSAKDVNLLPTQLLAIILATVGLAGLCVWIIGWD